jgi:hypothetical protein
MYNLIVQKGFSPGELLDIAMATIIGVELEQEVRYDTILRTRQKLSETLLNTLRNKHNIAIQAKLDSYAEIQSENQLRIDIAKSLTTILTESLKRLILKELNGESPHTAYLYSLSSKLHKAQFPAYDLYKIQDIIRDAALNNWEVVQIDTPIIEDPLDLIFGGET